MSQRTSVNVVLMGGAAATLLIYLTEPLLIALHGERPPPGIESAAAVLLTAVLAYLVPDEVERKIKRRTAPPREPREGGGL